jgi:hypothetical protein
MEKRRRARINQSLNELKKLLLDGNSSKKEVHWLHAVLTTKLSWLSVSLVSLTSFFSLLSLKRKVRLVRSPACLSVPPNNF